MEVLPATEVKEAQVADVARRLPVLRPPLAHPVLILEVAERVDALPAVATGRQRTGAIAVVRLAAMFRANRPKGGRLPKAREVAAAEVVALALPNVKRIQEDNLDLYNYHSSFDTGELDSGFGPAKLFRASPVIWMSGRILSASTSLIKPFFAKRPASSL